MFVELMVLLQLVLVCVCIGIIPLFICMLCSLVEAGNHQPVERDINVRWEKGIDHHPKSVELFTALSKIDVELCNDYFKWKHGGDGDNGETFMYQLDIYFECLDRNEPF